MPAAITALAIAGLAIWQPWPKAGAPPPAGQPATPAIAATPPALSPPKELSEARKLEAQARTLIDDDPLAVRENYHTAYELCERAVALSPDDGEIWATMARAHCVLIANYNESSDRQVALARSQAERAMRLAPQSIESGLAMAYFEGLNNEGVAAVRQRLLGLREKAPTDRRILQELVRVEEDENNPNADVSRRWAEQANALPGGDAKALVNLAWVYWGLNQYPELEAALARALAIQPTSGAYHLKLMVLTVHGSLTGDQTAARAWLQQIPPAILREDRVAMIANQTLYFARQPEAALKVLAGIPREILEEGRYFAPRGYLAGEALLMAGKPRAAEVEFRAALKVIEERLALDANNSRLVLSKGRILARLGDRDGAARQFETARELGVSSAMNLESLMLEGRNDDAIKAADALMVRSRSRWPAMLGSLKANPVYDPLRSDARFQQILARGEGWMEAMYHPAAAALSAESAAAAQSPASRLLSPSEQPTIDQKSVAVLAFANLSDDKANEYFSDGISEELLNVLAKVPGLKVSARTSAFYFKGKEVPVPEIARQLGVAYVVEGSVRKAGDKVRITAQLIKAADGFHVWSDTFTRDLKDIFAVQDEIAGLIAKNLEVKMGIAAARPTIDLEAYQEYLSGRALVSKAGNADLREAVGHFEKAVTIEPKFTAAWVSLASAHTQLGRWGGAPTLQSWAAARAAIDRALALEPDSPDVLLALGWIRRTAEWDWRGAEQAFRRSLELRPNHPDSLAGAAVLLFNVGQTEEAFRLGQQAARLDPLNAATQIDLSIMFYLNHNWREAEQSARRALQLAPGGGSYHSILGWSLTAQGRFDEAEAEIARDNNQSEQAQAFGSLAIARGQDAVARRWLARLEEIALTHGDNSDVQMNIAWLSVGLGDKDRAFAALERARTSRDPSLSWLRNSWYLESLRTDPRWPVFLRKVGLADDQLK